MIYHITLHGDAWAAGDPRRENVFASREDARSAIESLCALGGEWDTEWEITEAPDPVASPGPEVPR